MLRTSISSTKRRIVPIMECRIWLYECTECLSSYHGSRFLSTITIMCEKLIVLSTTVYVFFEGNMSAESSAFQRFVIMSSTAEEVS